MADQATDQFIEQVAAELRRPVRVDPSLDDHVMAAIEAPDVIPLHPRLPAGRPWYARPLTVHVSPIGFAAAAGLAAILALGAWQMRPVQQMQVVTSESASTGDLLPVANSESVPLVQTQFTFYQKGLESVVLVGEFNDWDDEATPLSEVSDGVWTVSLPLRAGQYEYQFILDGDRRVTDPTMPQVPSDFGSPNSVITITPPSR